MITTDLNNRELGRIARLHVKCLPGNILPMLGPAYLASFYQFTALSDLEEVLAYNDDDPLIKGVCVITSSAGTLFKRAIKGTFSKFLTAFAVKFLTSFRFQKICFLFLKDMLTGKAQTYDPQIAFIFVDPAYQGQGIGSHLLTEAEKVLADKGFNDIYVKTLSDPQNSAVSFYLKQGFAEHQSLNLAGNKYSILKKELA